MNGSFIILNEWGTIVNDPSQAAEIFNKFSRLWLLELVWWHHYSMVIPYVNTKSIPASKKNHHEWDEINSKFDFRPVTVELVIQNIKNINLKKAAGYDNIPGKLIKIANRELSVLICSLMNNSVLQWQPFQPRLSLRVLAPFLKVMITWTRVTSDLSVLFQYYRNYMRMY